jgi:hypothetical protein
VVRAGLLVPLVLMVIFLGAFEGSQSWGDLYSLVLFGALGWIMKHLGWPRPPLILGFVLGGIFERYFFISTQIYGAAWALRPVVLVVFALCLWVVLPPLKKHLAGTATTFRELRFDALRFGRDAWFSVVTIATILVAMWFSRGWPPAAKFVPLAACYIALFFAVLTLLPEIFGDPAAAPLGPAEAPTLAGETPPATINVFTTAIELRGVRFFGWLVAFLVVGAGIGLLPALCVLTFLLMRVEFTERWVLSAACAAVATIAIYLVFDRIFALPWPQSLIGDLWPSLRDATGLV